MISGVQVKLSHHTRRNPVRRKQQVTSLPISFLPGKQGSRQLDAMLRLTSGGAETPIVLEVDLRCEVVQVPHGRWKHYIFEQFVAEN